VNPHLLFDFFGTLAEYDPGRTEQAFPRSHALVPHLDYDAFVHGLDALFTSYERRSAIDHREFSMADAATDFLDRAGATCDVAEFERVYLAEWSAPVRPLPGLGGFLRDLRTRHHLAIVSNTHSPDLVPSLLARWDLAELFDAVVLSVDVGWCKPHPAMYDTALAALGGGPAVFVGDSPVPDYAGPRDAGIPALLIDPAGVAGVPDEHRLSSLFDLPGRLAAATLR
jgi:putative hydrolase of the HAD superfamily